MTSRQEMRWRYEFVLAFLIFLSVGCASQPRAPRLPAYYGDETIVDGEKRQWIVGERLNIDVRMLGFLQNGSNIDITVKILSSYRGPMLVECELLDDMDFGIDKDGRIVHGSIGRFSFSGSRFYQPSGLNCEAYGLTPAR